MDRIRIGFLFGGALLSSCATVGKMNQLRIGMSKAEAISVMGSPKTTSASDSIGSTSAHTLTNRSSQ